MEIVLALAKSTMDDTTVNAFMAFVNDDLSRLPTPEEILDAQDFKDVAKEVEALSAGENGMKRTDRLSAMCSRLFMHLKGEAFKPRPANKENFVQFMFLECIPKDLVMGLYMDIMRESGREVEDMVKDKRLASILIESL
jgi:hypothetical protein